MPTAITTAATVAVVPSQASAVRGSEPTAPTRRLGAAPVAIAAASSNQGESLIESGTGDAGRFFERAADLLDGDDAGEAAVGVDRHQRAEPAQVLVRQQRVERRVVADEEAAVVVDDVGDQGDGAGDLGDVVGGFALEQAEEGVRRV